MIRALSVVGHGTNLIPHFIDHYSKYVDEIQFIVYQSLIQPTLIDDVKNIIKKQNWQNTALLFYKIKLS